MKKTAIIFPGQGSQLPGMGADVAEAFPAAAETFAQANELLGFDLRQLCFEGSPDQLEPTDIQQPAILVTSIAIWRAITASQGESDWWQSTAGLSLGEYTALHLAGALSFEDAVRVVHRRGQLMQQAADAQPSGMVSLIGADEASANAVCEDAAGSDTLAPANFNCPGQVVISGHRAACDRAVELADKHGVRAVPLKVAGAFHSPLMQSAADELAAFLEGIEIRPPQAPVLSNVTADFHTEPAEIRRLLVEQVTHSVRWQQGIEKLLADGYERFIEVGPNRVLTGLMRKISRRTPAVNVSSADDVRNQELAASAA